MPAHPNQCLFKPGISCKPDSKPLLPKLSLGPHVELMFRVFRSLGGANDQGSSDCTVSAVFGTNARHSRGLSAVMAAHAELGMNYPANKGHVRYLMFMDSVVLSVPSDCQIHNVCAFQSNGSSITCRLPISVHPLARSPWFSSKY
jgi:hypothetical protein